MTETSHPDNAAPAHYRRLKVTRTITTTLRIEGATTMDVDEVIDAITLSPSIEVLKLSRIYRNHRDPSVRRYIDVRTVPLA